MDQKDVERRERVAKALWCDIVGPGVFLVTASRTLMARERTRGLLFLAAKPTSWGDLGMFTAPRIASKIEIGHWEPRVTATHHMVHTQQGVGYSGTQMEGPQVETIRVTGLRILSPSRSIHRTLPSNVTSITR